MSGGGGSSSDGGNDMQVSGAEAAYSTEKGISTAADTRVSNTSFSRGNDEIRGNNEIDYADSQGNIVTTTIGYGEGQVDPKLAEARLGADTSTVGIAAPDTNYSDSEIEKGYTDEGEKLANVNGTYMTKKQMYNTGIIEKDPETGQDVQGRYTVNPNTGELERTDMTFSEHWANAPEAIKVSPVLRFLYSSGKNIGEYFKNKNFQGYNEAGLRGVKGNAALGYGISTQESLLTTDAERDSNIMRDLAADAPYIVSGTEKPDSVAANWYKNLGSGGNEFFFSKGYADAKAKQQSILGNPTAVRYLAVNESPFYDWLKTNSLDKGIL
jgi:hypothetical protein